MPRYVERLRRAGLRVTGPRLAILAILAHDRRHPTPEQIFATLRQDYPSLARSTVYETLDAFLRVGLCSRVPGGSGRLRVEGLVQDHNHAVCRQCGEVFDVQRDLFPLPPPPAQLPNGFVVTGMRVAYEVVCVACRASGTTLTQQERGGKE